MSVRIETEQNGDGLTVVRLTTIDRTIVVPESSDGKAITSIGPSFLSGSPGGSGRTLVIPGCVRSVSPEAMEGASGIVSIEYGGDLETFESFKLTLASDCVVRCMNGDRPFEFEFIGGTPMSFPEFDDAVLSLCLRLTPEIAVRRLVEPVGLTDRNRGRYERFISDRVMPGAEQAVASGDRTTLRDLMSTGMVSDQDLRRLLDRSLRSGRIPITGMLMSEIRRRKSFSG